MNALESLIEKYAWVGQIEAWTVAVVEGRSVAEVLASYGGDLGGAAAEMRFAELAQGYAQVYRHDRRVLAIENNGYTGSIAEIARRSTMPNGRFFSVYWNVDAFGMLCQAIDGQVTAHFEHLYPFTPDTAPHEVRPEWAIGPEIAVESAQAACLALMERVTGVAFDPHWLGERRPTYRIPDPDVLLRGVAGARVP